MIRPRRSRVITGSRLTQVDGDVKKYALPELEGDGLYSPSAFQAFTAWFGVAKKLATVTGGEFIYESYACSIARRVVACHYLRGRTDTVMRLLSNYPGFSSCAYWHVPAWVEPHLRKTVVFVLPAKPSSQAE